MKIIFQGGGAEFVIVGIIAFREDQATRTGDQIANRSRIVLNERQRLTRGGLLVAADVRQNFRDRFGPSSRGIKARSVSSRTVASCPRPCMFCRNMGKNAAACNIKKRRVASLPLV